MILTESPGVPLVGAIDEIARRVSGRSDLRSSGKTGEDPPLSDRKIAHFPQKAGADGADNLPFEFELELHPGPNHVRLLARDAEGTTSRRDIWVYQEDGE